MAKQLRDIIIIDEDLCDGCGDCITACAEGALEIIDGKAKLKADLLCDGAGVCIGHCPTGAIKTIKREADEYDEVAVGHELKRMNTETKPKPIPVMAPPSGCPGSAARNWQTEPEQLQTSVSNSAQSMAPRASELRQWPVQLKLVGPSAPYFQNADLVIAADCVPFAYDGFHVDFLKGKALVVGCPKLDDLQFYLEKLTEIFSMNQLKSVEVLLMEVPCCGGLGQAAQMARQQSGAKFPLKVTTIGVRGNLLGSVDL